MKKTGSDIGRTVTAFYDLMFNNNNPRQAIEKFVGDGYIQHKPIVRDDKESFIQYFERMATEYTGRYVHFKARPLALSTRGFILSAYRK